MRIVALVVLSGCGIYHGNGDSETLRQDLDGVVAVEGDGQVSVDVEVGASEEYVAVTCDSNLIDRIRFEVSGTRLVVDTDDGWLLPKGPCHVDVRLATLEEIVNSGAGDMTATGDLVGFAKADLDGSGAITVEGIDSADVLLRLDGAGPLYASGTTDRVEIDHSGSGGIHAEDLLATDAFVTTSGAGPTSLSASNDVDVHLSGSGNVDVYGNPEGSVVVEDDGVGTIEVH